MADTYVAYLDAFQQEQHDAGKIRYCHTVTKIDKRGGHFGLTVTSTTPCTNATGFNAISNFGTVADVEAAGGSLAITTHQCTVLVMADGMWKATDPSVGDKPWFDGTDLTVRYDELAAVQASAFEGKRVMILGCGNAAFETADAVRAAQASDLAVVCRGPKKLLEETRYVGDIRAPRSLIFDLEQAGGHEATVELPGPMFANRFGDNLVVTQAAAGGSTLRHLGDSGGRQSISIARPSFAIVPCHIPRSSWGMAAGELPEASKINRSGFLGEPPRCLFEKDPDTGLVMLGWADNTIAGGLANRTLGLFGPAVEIRPAPEWLTVMYSTALKNTPRGFSEGANPGGPPAYDVMMIPYNELRKPLSETQLEVLGDCMLLWKGLHRRSYDLSAAFDVVILAVGWVYDGALFKSGGLQLALTNLTGIDGRVRQGVYPDLTPTHESSTVPHAFFVGANAHGLDRSRYRASGGFVHGFRYTTRTVFRTIVSTYEPAAVQRPGSTVYAWPIPRQAPSVETGGTVAPTFAMVLASHPLWRHLLNRVMFSAASYEMVGGALIDGIVFDDITRKATYYEELTEDNFHAIVPSRAKCLTFGFYAGGAREMRWGTNLFKVIRLPGEAPTGHPFHAVLEYWPPGSWNAWRQAESRQTTWIDPYRHPSSVFSTARRSSRFHFKADRNTDYTHSSQALLLDEFLRDIETTVDQGATRSPLSSKYHEDLDSIDTDSEFPSF